MTLQSGVYWNNAVAKEFMYFHVSQAPSGYYGFVCAVCFQGLLQQLDVLLIFTYLSSGGGREQSRRRTFEHHLTLYIGVQLHVSTSNLSNIMWYNEYNF